MKFINQIIEIVMALLPFLRKKNAKEVQEFTDLIKGQYEYLMEQLTKFQADYFELSEKVRQMYGEVINLNAQLTEALKKQCVVTACKERI